ncbi:ABC-F family ATP-binding cassette domain-containing protein [Candidatus Woesebacteria bacterium]|nr:ABC-F family ATP-binding cassette domain-containing protein [Candidatus Woesebacteria bacterium]
MIKVTELSFGYNTANSILDAVDFTVGKGQKIGLVGPNGAGKSTLLRILMGFETPTGGVIQVIGNMGYVPQEVKYDQTLENCRSIKEYLINDSELNDFDLRKFLDNLELSNLDLEGSPKLLSGGQKTKLALARALLSEPDILLLDEPTNFMDVSGKKFVMNFLSKYPKTFILISHDLKLLDKSIDKVLYVNIHTKKIEDYKGNYSDYLKLKKEREELLKKQIRIKTRHIESMKKSLTKISRRHSAKGVRQRVMMRRRIERLEEKLPTMPPELDKISLDLPTPSRVGELPIRAKGIYKSYGDLKVLENVDFSIRRGEKFVLIGPNGAGKSTLLKILVGLMMPGKGEVIYDYNLKFGYYSQEFENFDFNERVFNLVSRKSKFDDGQVRSILARFLFDENKIKQTIGSLSGGEKTRLSIALLVIQDFNLLILDEPTTYLDPMSQRIILEAIKAYKGTLLLVSHTEDFIKEINPTRALLLPENQVKLWSDDLLNKVIVV